MLMEDTAFLRKLCKREEIGMENLIKNTSLLGFGMMRLPRKTMFMDIEQIKQMVDLYLNAGFTYFDTAHVYPGSEEAMKKALVERHPRETYTIATKLYAPSAFSEKQAKQQFDTSLERMGTDYIDYYLLHTLMNGNYKKYEKYHLWDYVNELKAKGSLRRVFQNMKAAARDISELPFSTPPEKPP